MRFGLLEGVTAQIGAHLAAVIVVWASDLPPWVKAVVGVAAGVLAVTFQVVGAHFNPDGTPARAPYRPRD